MNRAFKAFCAAKGDPRDPRVEPEPAATAEEDAQLRLARIQNGAHPDYKNGNPKRP